MLANKINTMAIVLGSYQAALRRKLWRWRGLSFGKDCKLDRFACAWPTRVKMGDRCTIESEVAVKINHPFAAGYALDLSHDVFIARGCDFNISSSVKIGRGVLIAAYTLITDTGHAMVHGTPIYLQPNTTAAIQIGDGVWIGAGAIILPGVVIGRDAVIGAGSVVNKSIPENEVWAGSPARKIKTRS